jgi:hypothetical protein
MDFNWILVLGVIWFLANLLSGARRKSRTPPQVPERNPSPPALPRVTDATQREGSRLELMLRQFERALEEVEQAGRPAGMSLPQEEEVEDRRSLETEPEITSLEGEVRREVRQRVDQDDEAEQIEVRRIKAAAARDAARSKSDHAEFDQRIRQEPADHTATRAYTTQQLRDAVVWREVLGPPVSMREEEGER